MLLCYVVQSLSPVWFCGTPWTICNTPGSSVLHYLPEFAWIHVYWVGGANHLILHHSFLLLSSIFTSISFFPMIQLFASGGQSIGASTSVHPMNIQGCFPLGLTGLVSLQSKGLSRVFSSTTVQKHQFFSAQPSLGSNSHIHRWLLEKP